MAQDRFESAGQLPRFTHFGADLEADGVLHEVAAQISYRNELILVCGDGAPTASSSNALNAVLQLRALQLHHILFLSDSSASCYALRQAIPSIACVWSSRIPSSRPPNGGLAVQRYWSFAFYFYDLRKHYTAKLAIELGINVLHTDTDVAWLGNPYPVLKGVFGSQNIVAMRDRPLVNAGVFYVQNVREGDGAAWVLRELSRRIHLFMFHPEAVQWYVPWAQPPFFANVDEQTLMNDCLRSSIANITSYAQATAGWEVKHRYTGTRMNRSFDFRRTSEYRLLYSLAAAVTARQQHIHLPQPFTDTQICQPVTMRSFVSLPLHAVGSTNPPTSRMAIAPAWLFMHFPTSISAGYTARCVSNLTKGAPDAWSLMSGRNVEQRVTHRRVVPFIMGHMTVVRTGPWSRRSILRAVGWWQPQADHLLAQEFRWGRPARTLSLSPMFWEGDDSASMRHPLEFPDVQSLDLLVANMIVLGSIANRTPVLPHFSCGSLPKTRAWRVLNSSSLPGNHRLCAWVPPSGRHCDGLNYLQPTEVTMRNFMEELPAQMPSQKSPIGCSRSRTQRFNRLNVTTLHVLDLLLQSALCDKALHRSLLLNPSHSTITFNKTRRLVRFLKRTPLLTSLAARKHLGLDAVAVQINQSSSWPCLSQLTSVGRSHVLS